jgi:hypothetical protein
VIREAPAAVMSHRREEKCTMIDARDARRYARVVGPALAGTATIGHADVPGDGVLDVPDLRLVIALWT